MRLSSFLLAALLIAASSAPAWARLKPGKFGFSAPKLSTTPTGTRLDGNANEQALVRLPQLEVNADAIAVDGPLQNFTEVRARGNVALSITLAPSDNAGGKGETVHIESKSAAATLTRATRTLVLAGNLSGFYRVGDGPQTTLSGSKATFNYSGDVLSALIESENGGQVELILPAETGKADALGPVTVRADSIRLDQKNGAAYFTGNARAFSTSGANKLDVSAPSFTVLRAADGTIGTLTTNGKTLTKLDAPADPKATSTDGIGKPTHLEVSADRATINRATSTGIFDGNVQGFYRLQNSTDPFNFSGEQATVKYNGDAQDVASGLNVTVTGTPVDVELPAFDFKF